MNNNNSLVDVISSVQFTEIDYVLVVSLLFVSLVIGVYIGFSHNVVQTMDDFLFGAFKTKSVPVALSLLAR